MVEEHGAWQGEIRCRRKEGGSFPAMFGLNAVRDGNGVITHHVITLLDLSRLKAAEETARDERLFSESMMESTPGIIYFYDREGHFNRWNHNFAQVSGYDDEEIATMHPLDFFHAEDRSLLERRITEVFENGQAWVEAPFLTKDGRTIPYLFTGRRRGDQGAGISGGASGSISRTTGACRPCRRPADSSQAYFTAPILKRSRSPTWALC